MHSVLLNLNMAYFIVVSLLWAVVGISFSYSVELYKDTSRSKINFILVFVVALCCFYFALGMSLQYLSLYWDSLALFMENYWL